MKDGGSVFPTIDTGYNETEHEYTGRVYSEGGMSLRDYFAAAALQGMLASEGHVKLTEACLEAVPGSKAGEHIHTVNERLAWTVFKLADAMLLEREKLQGKTE